MQQISKTLLVHDLLHSLLDKVLQQALDTKKTLQSTAVPTVQANLAVGEIRLGVLLRRKLSDLQPGSISQHI